MRGNLTTCNGLSFLSVGAYGSILRWFYILGECYVVAWKDNSMLICDKEDSKLN